MVESWKKSKVLISNEPARNSRRQRESDCPGVALACELEKRRGIPLPSSALCVTEVCDASHACLLSAEVKAKRKIERLIWIKHEIRVAACSVALPGRTGSIAVLTAMS